MLQFIIGRSGSGKTTYVCEEICRRVEAGETGVMLLIPEQSSFRAGNVFLSRLGEPKFARLEITDFTRLVGEVRRQYGGDSRKPLDPSGRAALMCLAAQGVQDHLQEYRRHLSGAGFIRGMVDLYCELRACDVDFTQLDEVSRRVEEETLERKLHDISLILNAYEALSKDSYYDADEALLWLNRQLEQIPYFKGKKVYIDGFYGYTAREMRILEQVFRQAEEVVITFPADSMQEDGDGVFTNVKSGMQDLLRLARGAGMRVGAPVYLEPGRRFASGDLAWLEGQILRENARGYDSRTEAVSLYQAEDIHDECAYAAREIKRLLRSGACRCRDIVLVARDMEQYRNAMDTALKDYEIPVFHDERQRVDALPLMRMAESALRIVTRGFQSEDLYTYAKTGLLKPGMEEICALENYTVIWHLNGSDWKRPFVNHPDGLGLEFTPEAEARLAALNRTREELIVPLLAFRKRCRDATVQEIAHALYDLLIRAGADVRLQALARELERQGQSAMAADQGRVWDLLMHLLDQLVLVAGEHRFSLDFFADLFHLMISFQDLGKIPQGLDNITLGSADRLRADNPYAVFLLGANEGVFPRSAASQSVLSERERELLRDYAVELYSDARYLNIQEQFFAYMAASMPRSRLYVTWRRQNAAGEEMYPSVLVHSIRACLPDCTAASRRDSSDLDLVEAVKPAFAEAAARWGEDSVFAASLRAYFRRDEQYAHRIRAVESQRSGRMAIENRDTATRLFHKRMMLSASRAEDYHKCPFLYFCKYGLKARPRRAADMDPMQTGTVMHYVLERLLSEQGSDALVAMEPHARHEQVRLALEAYFNENLGLRAEASERFSYLFRRLEQTLCQVVDRLAEEFAQSEFRPYAYEMPIDYDGAVKPLEIPLEDGGQIALRGTVDRLDLLDRQGKRYVRVVDYKSGSKEFRLGDVLAGLNMQMLIYLMTLTQHGTGALEGALPAGVLYMPARRKVADLHRDAPERDVQKHRDTVLKMNGMVLADPEVITGMEREGRGLFVPAKLGKDGPAGSLITLSQMGRLSRRITGLLREMGEALHRGEIAPLPVSGANYEKTCAYCDYRPVCAGRREPEVREIPAMKHPQALEALEEGGDGDA